MNQFYILPPESVSNNNECIIPGGKYNYPQKFNKKGSKTVKNDYFKKKKAYPDFVQTRTDSNFHGFSPKTAPCIRGTYI